VENNSDRPINQQPPLPQQPINSIPHPKSKFKIILLIIFLLLIVGGGVYLLGTNKIILISKYFQKPTPTSVPKSPTPTPDPTANWKTYSNKEYGFEIKYPNTWSQKEFVSNPNQTFGIIFYEKEGLEKSVDIQIYNDDKGIENFAQGAKQITSVQKLSIGDYPAVKLGAEGAMGGALNIFKDGKRFDISCHESALEIWSQMLSAFKFTD
jgi:hypothetical protein